MLFTGLGGSVLGETEPEVLSTARGRRPRAVLRPKPMCVEEGRVRVDVTQSARSIANQNKALQHDF